MRQIFKKLPADAAQRVKMGAVYLRYGWQSLLSWLGYLRYGSRYEHPLMFIAGLPKSGTSWLEAMLASYPGFQPLLIPRATRYELRHGGSHDYALPPGYFDRFRKQLVVNKMHIPGSPHNARMLHRSRIKYIVLYRDLRDVAVSYTFYVRQTPQHPEHHKYHNKSVREGLGIFGRELLGPYARWVQTWEKIRHPDLSLMFRYEDLLADTRGIMTTVADHYQLDTGDKSIERLVEQHTFQKMSGGRNRGQASAESFFRRGTSGDWKNHFTPALKALYGDQIGDFLIKHDYESDNSWIAE